MLRYLPTNMTRPEIARELYVSINTVNTHIRNIYAKLGARDRSSAVERARELRLLATAGSRRSPRVARVITGFRRRRLTGSGSKMATWSSPLGLYAIRIRGRLGATALSAFPSMVSELKGSETVLTGVLEDRAALFGVLAQIEALGLDLLEVRRIGAQSQPYRIRQ